MSDPGQGTPPPTVPATPPAPAVPPAPAQASIEDFQKISLKTGIITAAADHPKADRLLVLTVDIGEGSPRQIVAGIKGFYQPSELVGKQVVVVANMKPAMLRGIESQGMVLAASNGGTLVLVSPERPMPAGSMVK
ncbi:MAG: methionine--tRNA ligase subunit beta [Candidatus Omnitrophica bacterium]|nr:methionine--tRNA ligase subunit beta [Candidatus Omnitrophota bacterium]